MNKKLKMGFSKYFLINIALLQIITHVESHGGTNFNQPSQPRKDSTLYPENEPYLENRNKDVLSSPSSGFEEISDSLSYDSDAIVDITVTEDDDVSISSSQFDLSDYLDVVAQNPELFASFESESEFDESEKDSAIGIVSDPADTISLDFELESELNSFEYRPERVRTFLPQYVAPQPFVTRSDSTTGNLASQPLELLKCFESFSELDLSECAPQQTATFVPHQEAPQRAVTKSDSKIDSTTENSASSIVLLESPESVSRLNPSEYDSQAASIVPQRLEPQRIEIECASATENAASHSALLENFEFNFESSASHYYEPRQAEAFVRQRIEKNNPDFQRTTPNCTWPPPVSSQHTSDQCLLPRRTTRQRDVYLCETLQRPSFQRGESECAAPRYGNAASHHTALLGSFESDFQLNSSQYYAPQQAGVIARQRVTLDHNVTQLMAPQCELLPIALSQPDLSQCPWPQPVTRQRAVVQRRAPQCAAPRYGAHQLTENQTTAPSRAMFQNNVPNFDKSRYVSSEWAAPRHENVALHHTSIESFESNFQLNSSQYCAPQQAGAFVRQRNAVSHNVTRVTAPRCELTPHASSRHALSQCPWPQRAATQHAAPRHEGRQRTVNQSAAPSRARFQYDGPQRNAHRDEAHHHSYSQRAARRNDAPHYAESRFVSPEFFQTEYLAPCYIEPEYIAAEYASRARVAPVLVAPEYYEPEYREHEFFVPEFQAREYHLPGSRSNRLPRRTQQNTSLNSDIHNAFTNFGSICFERQ